MKYLCILLISCIGLALSNPLISVYRTNNMLIDDTKKELNAAISNWELDKLNYTQFSFVGKQSNALIINNLKFDSLDTYGLEFDSQLELNSIQLKSTKGSIHLYYLFDFEYTKGKDVVKGKGNLYISSEDITFSKTYFDNIHGQYQQKINFFSVFHYQEVNIDIVDEVLKKYISETLSTNNLNSLFNMLNEYFENRMTLFYEIQDNKSFNVNLSNTILPFNISLYPEHNPLFNNTSIINYQSCKILNNKGIYLFMDDSHVSNYTNFTGDDKQVFVHNKLFYNLLTLAMNNTIHSLIDTEGYELPFLLNIEYLGKYMPEIYNYRPRNEKFYVLQWIKDINYVKANNDLEVSSLLFLISLKDEQVLLPLQLTHNIKMKYKYNSEIENKGISAYIDEESIMLEEIEVLDKSLIRFKIEAFKHTIDLVTKKILKKHNYILLKNNLTFDKLLKRIDSFKELSEGILIATKTSYSNSLNFLE